MTDRGNIILAFSVAGVLLTGFGGALAAAVYAEIQEDNRWNALSFADHVDRVSQKADHIRCGQAPEFRKWPGDPSGQAAMREALGSGKCRFAMGRPFQRQGGLPFGPVVFVEPQ